MPPFIEINGAVYSVTAWEPDAIDMERCELRRLNPDEEQRYRELKRESDIELWANMTGGD